MLSCLRVCLTNVLLLILFLSTAKYVRSEFEAYLKCGRLEYGFLRVRCEDCHHEHLVAFSWPLLSIHAPAAFVHPARHHAEGFSRGLPDPAVVRGEWQKAPPCWFAG